MVVVMQEQATEGERQRVSATVVDKEFEGHRSTRRLKPVLVAVGGDGEFDTGLLQDLQYVLRITEPYKVASRTFKSEKTVVSSVDV